MSESEAPRRQPSPAPRGVSPLAIALVTLGGSIGTSGRHLVGRLIDEDGGLPWATFTVNVLGAFALGLLLTLLAPPAGDDGAETGRRPEIRLLLGTGLLGGFTTYSALAVESTALAAAGDPVLAVGYPLGSVVLGVILAMAAVALARWAAIRSTGREGP